MSRPRGFALVTTLWVMSVAALIASIAVVEGRKAIDATRNRTLLERARWIATGCANRVRAAIDERLGRSPDFNDAERVWRVLDREVRESFGALRGECEVSLEAAGTRLDVNAASEEMLGNLVRAMSYDETSVARMVDAIADWRDTDHVARAGGAEEDWYDGMHRDLPRNGDIVDLAELARIRGFENVKCFDSVLSVDRGRISLSTARVSVLLALPGFTKEAAEAVVALSDAGTPLPSLLALLDVLSPSSRTSVLSRYPDIARIATSDPDAWILTVRASADSPLAPALLRLRLQRAGRRAIVTDGSSRS